MPRFLEAIFVLGWSLIGFAMGMTDGQAVHQLLPDGIIAIQSIISSSCSSPESRPVMLHWPKQ